MNKLFFDVDEKRLLKDLNTEILKAFMELTEKMAKDMSFYAKDPDVANSFRSELISRNADEIIAHVGSDHWMSFIENYGMGSSMATESKNEGLADYKADFFHSYRRDNSVRARPQGYYWRPNWESGDGYRTDYAQGRIPAGTNLETAYSWSNYSIRIHPKKPKFFMEKVFALYDARLTDLVNDIWNNFDFTKYAKGGI